MLIQSLATDAAVVAGTFAGTHVLYGGMQRYLKAHLSSWDRIKPATQNRMACEIALLPSRLAMFFCCLPIIVNSFNPTHMWMPSDTARSILAWYVFLSLILFSFLLADKRLAPSWLGVIATIFSSNATTSCLLSTTSWAPPCWSGSASHLQTAHPRTQR